MVDKIVPAGLRIWLLFLLCFVALGYPVVPSIFFGLIAGMAGGLISAWWQTKGGEPQPRKPQEAPGTLAAVSQRLRNTQARLKLPIPWQKADTRRSRRYSRRQG